MQQGGQCSSGFRLHYTVTILNQLLIPHMIVIVYTLPAAGIIWNNVLYFKTLFCYSLAISHQIRPASALLEKCVNCWSGCIFPPLHSGTISELLCSYTIALYLCEQLLRIWLVVPVDLMDCFGGDSKCMMNFDIFSANLPVKIFQTFGNTQQTFLKHAWELSKKMYVLYVFTWFLEIKAGL